MNPFSEDNLIEKNTHTPNVETHCNASLQQRDDVILPPYDNCNTCLQQSEPQKFRGKYRIESARLKGYDYSSDGAYFITICTKNREHFFGEIINQEIKLSEIGEIVRNEWMRTPEIRENVILDEWVIMPNHLHGIICIDNSNVETHCNASLQQCNEYQEQEYENSFGPQSNNLSAIIRGFKGAATKNIHIAGFSEFLWQSRFYDHIIRNGDELNRIKKYIFNNPFNWEKDKNNAEGLYM
ncbi:MAG: transposase [bacterium]